MRGSFVIVSTVIGSFPGKGSNAKISERHGISMTEESDVSRGALQPWMGLTIESSVSTGNIEIRIDNDVTVERYRDAATFTA